LKEKYGVKTVMDIGLHSKNLLPKHPVISKIESCNAGKEFLFLSPSGDVFPCSVSPVYDENNEDRLKFTAGNVKKTPILEIWHKSPVWTPFRYPKLNKPDKCLNCGYYAKKCFGSCPFGSYAEYGILNGEDPYCFVDFI
jgi:radical SAM protein with 4Fe4S-binding SPASM domain